MHHARSRKGCLTCRSKKVKCDEQMPKCRRCHRLGLQCEWAGPRSRPAARAKWKDSSMLTKILPKTSAKDPSCSNGMFEVSGMWFPSFSNPHAGSSTSHLLDDKTANVAAWDDATFFPAWNQLPAEEMGFPADLFDFGAPLPVAEDTLIPSDKQQQLAHSHSSSLHVHWPTPSPEPCIGVNDITLAHNVVLSPSFLQTGKEADALQYYSTVYPTMTVTKTVSWSTFIVVLRHGSQEPMIMHMVIAAALMDLAVSQKNNLEMCRAARAHAKAGMALLSDAVDQSIPETAASIITASYFLYRYMAVENKDRIIMRDWSERLCRYLQRNRLYRLCTDPRGAKDDPNAHQNTVEIASKRYGHLARLVVWTYYEDIIAGIGGYGGYMSRYLCKMPERMREVQLHSTAELESVWGDEYPEKEMVDDIENAPILTFLHDVLALYADVARVAKSSYTEEDKKETEDSINMLENRSRSLIRLTTITTQPRSRIMLNADYMIPYLYALRIYCFRVFLSDDDLSAPAPPAVQSAVHSILQLAQRSLSRGALDPMTARFQWPLLMAGIETSDNIHKEWVQSKMKTERTSKGFEKVLEAQEATGRRVPMALFAQILSGDGDTLS